MRINVECLLNEGEVIFFKWICEVKDVYFTVLFDSFAIHNFINCHPHPRTALIQQYVHSRVLMTGSSETYNTHIKRVLGNPQFYRLSFHKVTPGIMLSDNIYSSLSST